MKYALLALVLAMLVAVSYSMSESELSFSATATKTNFVNQDRQHDVPLTITVQGMPADLSINAIDCSVGRGLAGCLGRATDCNVKDNVFSCTITISPLDYTSPSVASIFDPSSRAITLTDNKIIITYSSEDGSGKATVPFDDLVLRVVPVCGNSQCERSTGESAASCCIDCSCPTGQYCYTGNKATGECAFTIEKDFYISGISPSTATAIPFFQKGEWHFTTRMQASLGFNMVSDYELYSVWMRIQGNDYKLNCSESNCSFVLPPLKASSSGDLTEVNAEFFALISYEEDGIKQAQNLQTEVRIPVSPQNTTVEGCKEKLNALDNRIETLSRSVKAIKSLCDYWAKEDTQYKLGIAVDECCKGLKTEDCSCEVSQRTNSDGSIDPYEGQDHSCYLCAKPCLCDNMDQFENLVSGYESYRENLGIVCSSTGTEQLFSSLTAMRNDISSVESSMNTIKQACEPVTKKSDKCQKDGFPTCSLESGLENHNDTDILVLS